MHPVWQPVSPLPGKAILDCTCTRLWQKRGPHQPRAPAAGVQGGSRGASGMESVAQPIRKATLLPELPDLLETFEADVPGRGP